jgi:type II secretory pathway pseudopilin PulG
MFQILRFKFCEKGITLVEIIVSIFMITMFSTILIANFPKILKEFALSRVSYKLAQDLRRVEDLGLSGVQLTGGSGELVQAKGYGIYIDLSASPIEQYILYADSNGDQSYTSGDYIIETIDITKENPNLLIKGVENISGDSTSINFTPPDPTVSIYNLCGSCQDISIVIGLDSENSEREVSINTSGLIKVK